MQAIRKKIHVSEGKHYILELTTCSIDDEEQMRYTTYGICLRDNDKEVLLRHKDISTNRSFVQRFIELCADRDVAAIHIGDLLEDYLD